MMCGAVFHPEITFVFCDVARRVVAIPVVEVAMKEKSFHIP